MCLGIKVSITRQPQSFLPSTEKTKTLLISSSSAGLVGDKGPLPIEEIFILGQIVDTTAVISFNTVYTNNTGI